MLSYIGIGLAISAALGLVVTVLSLKGIEPPTSFGPRPRDLAGRKEADSSWLIVKVAALMERVSKRGEYWAWLVLWTFATCLMIPLVGLVEFMVLVS